MHKRAVAVPQNKTDILWLCLLLGGLGSLAGVAALLRSGNRLERRTFWAALLNSGMFALAMGALIFHQFGADQWLLATAVSVLSGLGGHALIDFTLGAIKLSLKHKFGDDNGK
jgi:hypothetical protein